MKLKPSAYSAPEISALIVSVITRDFNNDCITI